jgi:hypothetical protein
MELNGVTKFLFHLFHFLTECAYYRLYTIYYAVLGLYCFDNGIQPGKICSVWISSRSYPYTKLHHNFTNVQTNPKEHGLRYFYLHIWHTTRIHFILFSGYFPLLVKECIFLKLLNFVSCRYMSACVIVCVPWPIFAKCCTDTLKFENILITYFLIFQNLHFQDSGRRNMWGWRNNNRTILRSWK